EDGIRDRNVTGVQTCALPIWGKLLMSKYAGRDYKKFALIAGFNEIGETIEETVHREVMEEVGLKVKNLTYYKSQPWSFSGTLLKIGRASCRERRRESDVR